MAVPKLPKWRIRITYVNTLKKRQSLVGELSCTATTEIAQSRQQLQMLKKVSIRVHQKCCIIWLPITSAHWHSIADNLPYTQPGIADVLCLITYIRFYMSHLWIQVKHLNAGLVITWEAQHWRIQSNSSGQFLRFEFFSQLVLLVTFISHRFSTFCAVWGKLLAYRHHRSWFGYYPFFFHR